LLADSHSFTHTHSLSLTHIHIHTNLHTHAHTHTHAQTHTHTHTQAEMTQLAERNGGSLGNAGKLNNMLMQMRKNCNHPDLITSAFNK